MSVTEIFWGVDIPFGGSTEFYARLNRTWLKTRSYVRLRVSLLPRSASGEYERSKVAVYCQPYSPFGD